jgi:hypothetical protein
MRTELIPIELHYLIKHVEKWGLGDDGYRDEQIINATDSELLELLESLPNTKMDILNEWLETNAKNVNLNMTDEYINYTCFLMAFEYAQVVFKNRKKKFS